MILRLGALTATVCVHTKTARPSSGLSSKFTHTAPWLTTDHSDQARSTNALYRWCSGWKVKNVVNISQNARCMLARCKVNHWLCILHFAILHNARCTRCQKQTTSAMFECCPVLDLATVALTLTHTFRHLHMCTLHISHLHTCTLHISHWNGYCSLHIAHCTLHIAHCISDIAYMLDTKHSHYRCNTYAKSWVLWDLARRVTWHYQHFLKSAYIHSCHQNIPSCNVQCGSELI